MKCGPIALAAFWVLLSVLSPSAVAAKVYEGWVIPETLIVRSGRGTDRRNIGTVHRGDKVFVTAFRDGWCWGKLPNGTWGWMMEKYLQFSAELGRKIAASAGKANGNSRTSRANGEQGSPAWIKVAAARVRSGPGTDYRVYGALPSGTKVYLLERKGDWAKVKTPGGEGWIHTSLLTDDVATGKRLAAALEQGGGATQTTAKVFVNADTVFLRSGPGTRFDYRARLKKGQALYVFEKKDQWLKGRVHGGQTGWIAGWLVKYPSGTGSQSAPVASPPPIKDFPSPTWQYRGGTALTECTAWVDEDGARVRYGPGFEHEVKAVLGRRTQVTVTDISGHWCKVCIGDGSYGWMAGWILDFDGPSGEIMAAEGGEPVEVKVGWVARTEINLRSGPSEEHDVVGKALLSTQVVVLDQKGDWYKVGLDGGREAWAASWLIDTREQRQVRAARKHGLSGGSGASGLSARGVGAAGSGFGAQLVREAMKFLGTRYSRGSSGGGSFDCSGLVYSLHRELGIQLARSSAAQYRQGIPVSRSELAMGDCVFFRNTYRRGISHVGIYVGGNKFIHASNPRSGVKIDSLDSAYYGPRYAGARRMR